MGELRLVVHGHFYQPPRENPWTDEVEAEPSAAPWHDWNDRITAECYRPNGWARVIDEHGRVEGIVNNYAHLSFNVGPTLMAWLERHQPGVYERMLAGDREGRGAIAQAYGHAILPLCTARDIRTHVRWGLADFAHRFGRPAAGMWLPETAVNDKVFRVLAEEGVGFTILAPSQASAGGAPVTPGRPYRWEHPSGDGRAVDLVFYDPDLSHDLAFGLTGLSSQELLRRVVDAASDGTPVCVATDGETFGHHHKWADRALAYAFTHEAAAVSTRVLTADALVRELRPSAGEWATVHESAWSCAHGVGRWKDDCGCSTGGEPGWNQRWRAPLRAALDVLHDFAAAQFERRGGEVLRDPWVARDAYVDVMIGRRSVDDFLAEHLRPGLDGVGTGHDVTARTLLEVQRHALAMYTSCGWFFHDLAGIETVIVLRHAACAIDLLREVGEEPPVDQFLSLLAQAESNVAEEGTGRDVWARHVEPARVDAARVTAHLALVELLEPRAGREERTLAGFEVLAHERAGRRRAGFAGSAGWVTLRHRRTGRRTEHAYAALHLGGLEVFGATRPADRARDERLFAELSEAVDSGARVTTLLRLVSDGFGPYEFGLDSALPGASDEIVHSAADSLVTRFSRSYEHLYADHRPMIQALISAGHPLPRELRVPAELALARRLDAELARVTGDDGAADLQAGRAARDVVREAKAGGFELDAPRTVEALGAAVERVVVQAVERPDRERVDAALVLLRLVREVGVEVDLDRAQEAVAGAGVDDGRLRDLARALDLAV